MTLICGEVEFEVDGKITAADLVGPLAGMTLTELKAGKAYVNVHTVAHAPGEIGGQIMAK